jgi:hypothetical protein
MKNIPELFNAIFVEEQIARQRLGQLWFVTEYMAA